MGAGGGWGAGGVRAGFVEERRRGGAGSGSAGGRFQVQRLEAQQRRGLLEPGDLLSTAPLAPVVCFCVSLGDDRFCEQGLQLFIKGHPRPGAPTPRCRGCEALIKKTAEARDPSTVAERAGCRAGTARVRDRTQPCPLCFQGVPCPPPQGETWLHQSRLG